MRKSITTWVFLVCGLFVSISAFKWFCQVVPEGQLRGLALGLVPLGVAIYVIAGALSADARPQVSAIPSYDLTLRVEPESHRIRVHAVIENPPTNRFYLNERLEIHRITCDGQEAVYAWDDSGEVAPYTQHGQVVQLETGTPKALLIEYRGFIAEIENGVNMVNSELVELAYYASWYPSFIGSQEFSYRLWVDVPADFVTTTNGRELDLRQEAGRQISRWESYGATSDIVIVSSPLLRAASAVQGQLRVEMLYANLDSASVNQKGVQLVRAMRELSALYGSPNVAGILRFVYSPREGWGYSRIPLLVVPEAYAHQQERQEFGTAQDLHGAVHELTHFWWRIADSASPNDWINEGLAEYSAFRLAGLLSGSAFQQHLVDTYRSHAQESPTDVAIADTPGDSDARYVNRYERATLMCIRAAELFGQQPLDSLLRRLLDSSAAGRPATTEFFLEAAERHMGTDGKVFFAKCLHEPGCPTVLEGITPD